MLNKFVIYLFLFSDYKCVISYDLKSAGYKVLDRGAGLFLPF